MVPNCGFWLNTHDDTAGATNGVKISDIVRDAGPSDWSRA